MPEIRKKYDREFCEGAVRIVEETNKSIAQVARDLGVNEGTLGHWVAKAGEAREGAEGLSKGDIEELKRLRAENAELACEAIKMAVAARGGAEHINGVIFHTDRGSTYTADKVTALCRRLGIRQSMGRVGSCFDNVAAEAFFSSLAWEVLSRHEFTSTAQAHPTVIDWAYGFHKQLARADPGRRPAAIPVPPETIERSRSPSTTPAATTPRRCPPGSPDSPRKKGAQRNGPEGH